MYTAIEYMYTYTLYTVHVHVHVQYISVYINVHINMYACMVEWEDDINIPVGGLLLDIAQYQYLQ